MSAFTTVTDKIKHLLRLDRTGQTQPPTSPENALGADAARSNFLANQSKDRAAKLAEVQDKAAQGAAD